MNVGIIVLSNTGNTLSVAQRLKDALTAKGHTVSLERVTAMSQNPNTHEGKQLKDAPNTQSYDVLIFGAPVWAFSLSSVMKAYLSQLPALDGKKTACFVTQQLAHAWLGGNKAIREMKTICLSKGAVIFETGVVNWSKKERENQIATLIEKVMDI